MILNKNYKKFMRAISIRRIQLAVVLGSSNS